MWLLSGLLCFLTVLVLVFLLCIGAFDTSNRMNLTLISTVTTFIGYVIGFIVGRLYAQHK